MQDVSLSTEREYSKVVKSGVCSDMKWVSALYLMYSVTPRVLFCKRLMGMCHWMGLHFHDWIDYNGAAFSISDF